MRSLSLILCLALGLSSCSHFTASGKQKRVYMAQMKKAEKKRKAHQKSLVAKQRASIKKLPPTPPISEPHIFTSVESVTEQ